MPIDPSLTSFPTARALPGTLARGFLWVITLGRSGRMQVVHEEIARAGLPARASSLVLDVCKRSPLWSSERREVARELCGHLRSGLDAGVGEDELIRTFGDVRTSARLITRARRRQRPLAWRIAGGVRLALGWTLAGLAAIYAILALRFWTGEPTLARNIYRELTATYVDAVPEAQRAWPLYREAIMQMPAYPTSEAEIAFGDNWPDVRPGDAEYALAVEYAKASAPQYAMIREAATRSAMGFAGVVRDDVELTRAIVRRRGGDPSTVKADPEPVPENPVVIEILLPHLGYVRSLARHLSFDTNLAALEGDRARVVANLRTLLGMSRQVEKEPFLISQLVAYAVNALACNKIALLLHEYPDLLTREDLVALAHNLATSPAPGRIVPRFDGERLMLEDAVQRVYTDNGKGDGHLTPQGMRYLRELAEMSERPEAHADVGAWMIAGPVGTQVVASRRELLDEYDRLMALTERNGRLQPWERIHEGGSVSISQEIERISSNPWWVARYTVLKVLMPALDQAYWAADQLVMQRDATLCVIAMHLYRRETGRWPATLADLAPRFMPEVPRDMYTGKPLLYLPAKGESGTPTLYSIGRDLRDDGGVPSASGDFMGGSPRRLADNAPPADLVFWPVTLPARSEPKATTPPPAVEESEGESVPVPQRQM